jgi:hypothetical protein
MPVDGFLLKPVIMKPLRYGIVAVVMLEAALSTPAASTLFTT